MKKLTTVISSLCLLLFGAIVGLNNSKDPPTAMASTVLTSIPFDLKLSNNQRQDRTHIDTVYVDSIVYRDKPKRVPYAVHDTLYVPVLYIAVEKVRKEATLDSTKYHIFKARDCDTIQKPIAVPDSLCDGLS